MFAKDVMRMIRNVIVVEKAILQFEREIVSRVRSKLKLMFITSDKEGLHSIAIVDGLEPGEFYGAGAEEHPLTLTRTERERFIHTYYSLWGLLRIDTSAWDSRLQAMTSRELYYLHEMTKLTQSIGREETVPPPIYPNATSDSVNSTNHGRSEKRDAVERRVWQQIQHNSLLFFDRDALHAAVFAKHEGALEFVAIWDHWQPSLKEMVLHESRSTIKLSSAVKKEHFWNDE